MRERGRERAVKLTLPVGKAGEFDPLCKLHSRQRNTLKKSFSKLAPALLFKLRETQSTVEIEDFKIKLINKFNHCIGVLIQRAENIRDLVFFHTLYLFILRIF